MKIRKTLSEWKIIRDDVQKIIQFVNKKQNVRAYSIEVTFLEALAYLEDKAAVPDLEVIQSTQVAGVKDSNMMDDFEGRSSCIMSSYSKI